ncbi:hypothetical protein A2U01_0091711, partial [Trifolium medium]|nr:hypothetical protein [Trifolium medium]
AVMERLLEPRSAVIGTGGRDSGEKRSFAAAPVSF